MTAAKILIVEDDEDMCEELKDILEYEKYEVDICYDGRAAMESIKNSEYDIVVLDLKMPHMSGYEILKYFSQKKGSPRFLVLSGTPVSKDILGERPDKDEQFPYEDKEKNACLRLADAVINKPFNVEDVLSRLQKILNSPSKALRT
ncbi:MAG: response regulator [Candidatus Omnitrophota bacterium]